MKVMIGLDESEGSFYALNWALSNLLNDNINKEDATPNIVYLVHVNPPFQTYVYPAGPAVVYTTTTVLDSVKHAQEHISAAIFSRALHSCHQKRIKAETFAMRGDPKEMICQAAEQMHVDLLVVGSRGLGMLKRAFLGSVSDYCVHHAHCPVLIVKPPKELAKNHAQAQAQAQVQAQAQAREAA
ncbi:hypothetical protein RND81_08G165800 [Saponaria officinalis]|uniref:UspA domain-containing protein n=1 Tax=Saponaria officinalis TaxID=3572 RepID=A0AAW1J9A2_SAPOF